MDIKLDSYYKIEHFHNKHYLGHTEESLYNDVLAQFSPHDVRVTQISRKENARNVRHDGADVSKMRYVCGVLKYQRPS